MKNKLLLTTALVAASFIAHNSVADVISIDTTYDDAYASSAQQAPRGGDFEARGAKVTFKDTASFTENKATGEPQNNGYGGAIFIDGVSDKANTSVKFEKEATFTGNTAVAGGAIYNQATLIFDSDATFTGNSATDGGALVNHAGATTEFNGTATFSGNHATDTAGALSNAGIMTFEKLATFSGNYAETNQGSVFGNGGTMTFKNGLVIDSNGKTPEGGAQTTGAGNSGTLNITGGDLIVTNNKANRYSGFYNGAGTFNVSGAGTINFSNNEAIGSSAGALGLHENSVSVSLAADSIVFDNNKSTGNGYGGAIFTAADLDILGASNTFSNNKSITTGYGSKDETYYGGGAIHARSVGNDDTVTIGTSSSTNTFLKNTSNEQGGAIFARNAVNVIVNGTTTFGENTASKNGGAIYVRDAASAITFNGNTTFSNNTANGVANDIYNAGTINFNGDVTLDGGISGNGTVVFANGTNVNAKANETKIANAVINNGATLNLIFNSDQVGTYQLVSGGLDNEFTIAENSLYNIESKFDITADVGDKGTYEISKKSSGEVAKSINANGNEASAITAITDSTGTASGSPILDTISQQINDLVQSGDAVSVQAAKDAATALAPDTTPSVQQTSVDVANQVFSAVGTRLSGGSVAPASQGMASGDNPFENVAVWIQGLFNKAKLDNTSKAKGYDADTYGAAFGIEKKVDNHVKYGIGYAYSETDIDGFLRDTDITTHTAIVYGEYKPTQWYVNGVATYSWSDYEEKKAVLGTTVKSKYDVDAIALQLMTGYEMNVNGYGLTPEVGLRYVHVKQDSYTDATGNVSGNDSDILTGVIGAKVSKNVTFNDWLVTPVIKAALTYDITHDNSASSVLLANGSAYSVRGQALDRFGVELGAGVTTEINDKVEMSVGYEGHFRDDYRDHSALINAKYKF